MLIKSLVDKWMRDSIYSQALNEMLYIKEIYQIQ